MDMRINLPGGEKEINLILTMDGMKPAVTENCDDSVFCDNGDAMLFNAEISLIVPRLKSLSFAPDAFTMGAVCFGSPSFAKEYLAGLIRDGFLDCATFPYIDDGRARAKTERFYLASGLIYSAAVAGDSLLRGEKTVAFVRKCLAAKPKSVKEAVLLYELNGVAHDVLNDRLFTVSNTQKLLNACPFLTEWQSVRTRSELTILCRKIKIPRAYRLLTVFTKIYGIKIQNCCLCVRPVCPGLPSLTVKLCGKELFMTFVGGYPKKTYLGNLGFDGCINVPDIADDRASLSVTC